ncbi:MAG: ABC transporter transmembrane domain-containing protein, partial [Methanobacteriota archaeon]
MSDAATGPVKEKKVRKGTLGRLMKYLMLQKGKLLISLVLLTIGTFTFLYVNLLLGDVINILTTTKDIRSIINIARIMGGLSVITLICLYIGFRFITDVTQNALFRLRQEIFEHMQTLSLRFFDKQPIGELMSRVTNDMDTINNLFQAPFGLTLQSAIMLVLTIIALF